jgi:hypothetical protein
MELRDSALFLDDVYFSELNRWHKLAHGRELDRNDLMKPRPKKWADNFKADVFFHNPPEEAQMQPLR